jgi:F-type H+-transporting ATPase subunit delta
MSNAAAKRYAEAVFGLAKEKGNFEQWQHELRLLDAVASDPQTAHFLENPAVPALKKQALLDSALAQNSQESRNLARMLLERHRLGIVHGLAERFDAMLLAERGIAVAQVTTAEQLDPQAEVMVKDRLNRLTGKEIQLETAVDPSMIGGIVVQIGDQLIDGSVVTQLRQLRARLATG